MTEIWKKINLENFEHYEISNLGRVRNSLNGKILQLDRCGGQKKCYYMIRVHNSKTVAVHRLVAMHFLDNPNNYPVVNHIDEDPSNNSVENLEWCTYKYNSNHGTVIERRKQTCKRLHGLSRQC